jgi:hypothetical protein
MIKSATISTFLITDMTSDTMLVAGALNSRFMVNISNPPEIFRTAYRKKAGLGNNRDTEINRG